MKIVSLLPSATEIICSLGLGEHLVGVTHECDYPEFVKGLPKVTHTLIPTDASSAEIDRLVRETLKTNRALYTLDQAVLEQLQPDLIVTQTLCDVCAVAEDEVRAAVCSLPGRPRIVTLEPQTLNEVFDAIKLVGEVTGTQTQAQRVIEALGKRVAAVVDRSARLTHRPRVAFIEWLDPPFAAGHWNPELVRLAGGLAGLGREGLPSRTLRWEEVVAWEPEVLFIACCGFSVERALEDLKLVQALPFWHTLPAVKSGRVYVADGSQYFNRPGPRLVDSLEILAHALHPDVHPIPLHAPPALHVPCEPAKTV